MKNALSSLLGFRLHLLSWVLFLAAAVPIQSLHGGLVNNCTDADLRAAVNAGGLVTIACDGVIVLTNSLVITQATTIDATGHQIVLSGSNSVRLFVVQPGVVLALKALTLADGRAAGTNGALGQNGGPGQGGAIQNNGGTLHATDCAFLRNTAVGGRGGNLLGPPITGAGGTGAGGAIDSSEGQNFLTNVVFNQNRAKGGRAGDASFTDGANSGTALGGAIRVSGGALVLQNCQFHSNGVAFGDTGTSGMTSGSLRSKTGNASGGAVYSEGTVSVMRSEFRDNACGFGVDPPAVTVRGGAAQGGAIYHRTAKLVLTDCALFNNIATGGPGYVERISAVQGANAAGGALFLNGDCALTNCALAGNLAEGGAAGGPSLSSPGFAGSGMGGGIHNQSLLTVGNCTLAENDARGGKILKGPGVLDNSVPGSGLGGGLFNDGGAVTVRHDTIAGNSGQVSPGATPPASSGRSLGGGLYSTSGTVTLLNSIIAHSPSGSNGFGTFIDGGRNLSSDGSFNFAPPSLNNTDPHLGPLTNYGGPTPTMALLAGSVAIDGADFGSCAGTDQRGIARPFGSGCDIGAFESAPPYTIIGRVLGYTNPPGGIQISTPSLSTSVEPTGQFLLHGFPAGTHVLSISSPTAVCAPKMRSVTVGPDVVDVTFNSYRSNALVIERIAGPAVHGVYAGAAGQTYRVLASDNPSQWVPWRTNMADANGLVEFVEPTTVSPARRFYQVVRP